MPPIFIGKTSDLHARPTQDPGYFRSEGRKAQCGLHPFQTWPFCIPLPSIAALTHLTQPHTPSSARVMPLKCYSHPQTCLHRLPGKSHSSLTPHLSLTFFLKTMSLPSVFSQKHFKYPFYSLVPTECRIQLVQGLWWSIVYLHSPAFSSGHKKSLVRLPETKTSDSNPHRPWQQHPCATTSIRQQLTLLFFSSSHSPNVNKKHFS